MRFTVLGLDAVEAALIELWTRADDQQAVAEASDWIDRQLKDGPLNKVTRVDDYYFLRRDPLVVLCTIDVADRVVTIIELHRIDV